MAQILCIGGDAGFCERLAESLRGEARHASVRAPTGEAGLALARTRRPDLVILAWSLPDTSGLEVCAQLLLGARHVPVLFVAEAADEEERIRGFVAGAADFVVMPASVREIALRVQAILRRVEQARQRSHIAFGSLRIDKDSRQVWVAGQEIAVTRLELDLLLALYEGRGRGLSREELRTRAWGRSAVVRLRVIDRCVKRLRDKLGPAGDYVETVRGLGYRLSGAPGGAQPPNDPPGAAAPQSGPRLAADRSTRAAV